MAVPFGEQSLDEWFCSKALRDDAFLGQAFLPSVRQILEKLKVERDRANMNGTFDQIKYAQGRLDGVQSILNLMGMLKQQDTGKPPLSGSMTSIAGSRRSNVRR